MAKIEDAIGKLVGLSEGDLDLIVSLSNKLKELSQMGPNDKPTDAELYWIEMVGDNSWQHAAAEGLWAELASIQMNPTANFRRIQQVKLRLRALGEL